VRLVEPKSKRPFVHYDPEVDILYISGREGLGDDTLEISPGVYVEATSKGELLSVEVWKASRRLGGFARAVDPRRHTARRPATVADRPRK